jgi:two-component system OmpR family sensor kinase
MKLPGGLVGRLLAALMLVTTAFGLTAAAIGSITLHSQMNEAMDVAMQQAANRLLPLVLDDLPAHEAATGPRRLPEESSDEDGARFVYQVRDSEGRLLIHSHDAPAEPFPVDLRPGFSEAAGWRVYTVASAGEAIFVQVAERDRDRDAETLEAATGFLIPLAALMPIVVLAAWLVLTRFLKPLAALRAEIGERHGDNLAPIEAGRFPSELAAIAKSVNVLMRRLRMTLDAEKEFTANAAHELRTPIAGALAQAERLLAEAADEPTRRRTQQIRSALGNLARLSEKLMQLAKADAGVAATSTPVDIAALSSLVVEEFRHGQDGGGRISLERPPGGRIRACIDADAFAIVLRNLIENALRHGAADRPVAVHVGQDGAVSVVNEGTVVPAASLKTIVKRFARGRTGSDGAGLGLAIVNRIVQQAGATLTLHSPAAGRDDGFEAIVRFPAA